MYTRRHAIIAFWLGMVLAFTLGPAVMLELINPIWFYVVPFVCIYIFLAIISAPELLAYRRETRERKRARGGQAAGPVSAGALHAIDEPRP